MRFRVESLHFHPSSVRLAEAAVVQLLLGIVVCQAFFNLW